MMCLIRVVVREKRVADGKAGNHLRENSDLKFKVF